MADEKIGVVITFTDAYSVADGIAVAIYDPIYEETRYEFYKGKAIIDLIKKYLKDGLEIRSIYLYNLKFTTGREAKFISGDIESAGFGKIPICYAYSGSQPFAGATIPPNH